MDRYRVKPGQQINLTDYDPDDKSVFDLNKKTGKKKLKDVNKELETLQETLYAENKHKILIILQAMDTGGKDGTIRHVFEGVNPQGVRVASFKKPTEIELSHDYLWRIHHHTPAKGEIVIFNRSHYEDVLVVRVHELVDPKVWQRRFEHINAFEQLLADEGTTILKFFLHIDQKEQKERLLARLQEPDKRWKFNPNDLAERKYWNDYMRAYTDVLNKTSTEWAPWVIVPANRKWYRNLVSGTTIVDTLKKLNIQTPSFKEDVQGWIDKVQTL
ncbi:polyphosphate kinase 2 family protein [candidate division KSB1 bacterium]|nr:polyphosphate kinase 2 family protein [candidate division KSB1 bacterium]